MRPVQTLYLLLKTRLHLLLMAIPQTHNSPFCGFSLLSWNCCGLKARLPEIRHLCTFYDVLCLQKTLISPFFNLNITDFDILCNDIIHPDLRGTAILIRSYIRSTLDLSALSHSSIEIQDLAIQFQNGDTLQLINIYRHPASNTPTNIFENIFNLFKINKLTIFLGDFNAHHSSWHCHNNDYIGERLTATLNEANGFLLNNGSSTRISSPCHSSSVIDLVLASSDLAFHTSSYTFSDTHDHFPIHIRIEGKTKYFRRNLRIPKICNRDIAPHIAFLEKNTHKFLEQNSNNSETLTKYNCFIKFISHSSYNSLFSENTSKPRLRSNPVPWWNDVYSRAVQLRRDTLRCYKYSPTYANFIAYKKERAICKRVLLKEKRLGWCKFCSNFNHKTPTSLL